MTPDPWVADVGRHAGALPSSTQTRGTPTCDHGRNLIRCKIRLVVALVTCDLDEECFARRDLGGG